MFFYFFIYFVLFVLFLFCFVFYLVNFCGLSRSVETHPCIGQTVFQLGKNNLYFCRNTPLVNKPLEVNAKIFYK